MKKGIHLWIVAVILTILSACDIDQGHGESAERSGYETSGDEPEGSNPGTEMSGGRTETEKSDSETSKGEENAAFTERVYERDIIYYSEQSGGYHLRKDVEKVQTDYAAYYFEIPISEQERNTCIAVTDRMLSRIDAELPDFEIVVLTKKAYDGVSISGNRLYLSPQPWDSADYFAKVLLAGYGEWGNYGLAYGYADYLGKKANPGGWEADGFLPMGALELYDLNLLCFDEKFVSLRDVEAVKNNACVFVRDYLSSHSEEEFLTLLSASGTVEGAAWANEALEAFYAENGVDCCLTEVRYQYGGVSLDYAAACEYACFYIYKGWQDFTWEKNPMVSENFLHEDYGEVRDFFEYCVHQMRHCQELFGFDSYNNALTVFLKNSTAVSSPSFYYRFNHAIQLESVASLIHEYIHSLMYGHFDDWEKKWKVEGVATYFSDKYDLYAFGYLNDVWNNSSSMIWLQEYINSIGRPIDFQTDFREVEDLTVHAYMITDPDSTYQSGSSFVGYLIDQYGEQAVIAYVFSDNKYNAEWDKSYDELVQDWRKYIKDNYSQYSTVRTRHDDKR